MNTAVQCRFCIMWFIRPPRKIVPEGLMFYYSLLFFFPRSVGWSLRNVATWSKACSVYKCQSENLGTCPQKNFGVNNMLNLAQFWTPFHFECEYLWNGQRYPKLENYLTDSISSRVQRKKFDELWSTNHWDLEVQLHPENRLFWNTIFWPLEGTELRNFYTCHRMAKSC